MQTCTGNDIYCDLIIPRKLDIDVVKETDNVLAFYHTKPYWQMHIVITPKKHVASVLELSQPLTDELLSVIKDVAGQIKDTYGACRVITNLGDYQDSKHLHVHLSFGKANT